MRIDDDISKAKKVYETFEKLNSTEKQAIFEALGLKSSGHSNKKSDLENKNLLPKTRKSVVFKHLEKKVENKGAKAENEIFTQIKSIPLHDKLHFPTHKLIEIAANVLLKKEWEKALDKKTKLEKLSEFRTYVEQLKNKKDRMLVSNRVLSYLAGQAKLKVGSLNGLIYPKTQSHYLQIKIVPSHRRSSTVAISCLRFYSSTQNLWQYEEIISKDQQGKVFGVVAFQKDEKLLYLHKLIEGYLSVGGFRVEKDGDELHGMIAEVQGVKNEWGGYPAFIVNVGELNPEQTLTFIGTYDVTEIEALDDESDVRRMLLRNLLKIIGGKKIGHSLGMMFEAGDYFT